MDEKLKSIIDWNAEYKIGTPVHVTTEGRTIASTTTSEAILLGGVIPVIWVASRPMSEMFPLALVKPQVYIG